MMCDKPIQILVGVLDLASKSKVPRAMARLRLSIVCATWI
jgi:hypothetical protein